MFRKWFLKDFSDEINRKFDAILLLLQESRKREIRDMADVKAQVAAILAGVTEETTLIGGIGKVIDGLKQQVADALANMNIPPDVQANLDAIFSTEEANKAALAAALAANVPPPAPPPA